MDLGAWLRPGGSWAASLNGQEPCRLVERRGRPVWIGHQPHPVGRVLTITVELTGFLVETDGGLATTDSPTAVVRLELLGQVRACRYLLPGKYMLRLKLLGRII